MCYTTFRMSRRILTAVSLFGFEPLRLARSIRGLGPFLKGYRALRRQAAASGHEFPFGRLYPCLEDRYQTAGAATGHYFHQDLHVAQLIFRNRPARHVDVGSRVDGFVAHVASFRPIEVLDIRPMDSAAPNIVFRRANLMEERFALENYCDSLSCLHTLEHFGLGRYGDPIDYYGYKRGWANLHRMLEPGGKLYFSVPMGPQRIEFDAHRVFSMPFLVSMAREFYTIDSFAYVNDAGDLVREADPTGADAERNFGCTLGCAIFELTKRPPR